MIYRIVNNIYANVEGKDVNIGYVCVDNDNPNDFKTMKNFTNSEVISLRLDSKIYDDGSRWCAYTVIYSVKNGRLINIPSNLDVKWIIELIKLGYNIIIPNDILSKIRHYKCDHCGKLILEGDEYYSDNIDDKYYCSILCLALDKMNYTKKYMTRETLDKLIK